MKIAFVAGTRPNFVKIAPLIKECEKENIEYFLIHTGQHYDKNLSEVFFKELQIPEPNVNLQINAPKPKDLKNKTAKEINKYLVEYSPDVVVVVGDSDATAAGAMAAKLSNFKLAHIEAGLRSFYMAMPEEHNRLYIDKVADYLFITEQSGMTNLINAKAKGKKFFVGNVMIDSLILNLDKIKKTKNEFADLDYAVATLHRKSNVDEVTDLKASIDVLNYVAKKYIKLVLPFHPRTLKNINEHKIALSENIFKIEPQGYIEFQKLILDSRFAISDSGGIQDETTFYKKPCLTLRENTERPITYRVGTSVLVGRNMKLIDKNITKILKGEFKKGKIPKYWDGKSSKRILTKLKKLLS